MSLPYVTLQINSLAYQTLAVRGYHSNHSDSSGDGRETCKLSAPHRAMAPASSRSCYLVPLASLALSLHLTSLAYGPLHQGQT